MRSISMKGNTSYECTASDSAGPIITWSLYHKNSDSWENLGATSGDDYTIQAVNVSSCVIRSSLVIDPNRGFPVVGDIVACTAQVASYNTSAYFYLGRLSSCI